eukprot:10257085-Prorocentrum_lima.AAC.1
MTSSLVGSEMCIRDRPRFNRALCAPSGRGAPSQATSAFWATKQSSNRGCLLYTSDAADDM